MLQLICAMYREPPQSLVIIEQPLRFLREKQQPDRCDTALSSAVLVCMTGSCISLSIRQLLLDMVDLCMLICRHIA